MDYATHECADCHGLFSANQMVKVSDRVKTGESITPEKWQENGIEKTKVKTTSHYQNQRNLICTDCKRKRTRRLIMMFLLGLGAVAAWFVIVSTPSNETRQARPAVADGSAIDAVEPSSADDPNESLLAADNSDVPATEDVNVPESSTKLVEGADSGGIPSAKQMSGAVAAALESGRSTAWTSGNQSGEVAVSEPVQITGSTCRTISTEGDTATWCRVAGEDWKLSR